MNGRAYAFAHGAASQDKYFIFIKVNTTIRPPTIQSDRVVRSISYETRRRFKVLKPKSPLIGDWIFRPLLNILSASLMAYHQRQRIHLSVCKLVFTFSVFEWTRAINKGVVGKTRVGLNYGL